MIAVPGREPVEAVGEVHAVHRAGDDQEEQHVPDRPERDRPSRRSGRTRRGSSCWWCAAKPTATVIPSSSSIFQRPAQPERALVAQLDVVVEEADRAAGERACRRSSAPAACSRDSGRNAIDAAAMISRPPIVGVPCLRDVVLRALLADVLAELVPAQERDERRAAEDRDDHRDERCDEDSVPLGGQVLRDDLESHRARALHEHDVARPQLGAQPRRGLGRRRRPTRRRRRARARRPRSRARSRARARARRSRAWYAGASAPSSAISPSTATRRCPPPRSARCSSAARIETGFAL